MTATVRTDSHTGAKAAILRHVERGQANGISAKALARRVSAEAEPVGASTVRDLIAELRDEGWPICSVNGYGYFLPEDRAEFVAHVRRINREIESKRDRREKLVRAYYG